MLTKAEISAVLEDVLHRSATIRDAEYAEEWLKVYGYTEDRYTIVNFLGKVIFYDDKGYFFFKLGYEENK